MTTIGHVLLVDDDAPLIGVLEPLLRSAGCKVSVATSGNGAIDGVLRRDPDVVLLDLGLPDLDGKTVIRTIRESSRVPIIVISARHQADEKIAALDEGADDYVNKPFEIGELMARVRAAIRRSQSLQREPSIFEGGPLRIDYSKRQVELFGERVRLSPKEYMLLHTLARNAGQIVTQKRLLAAGWGSETADSQYLRVYIGLLRQKIEADPAFPELVITEPGLGYRLGV